MNPKVMRKQIFQFVENQMKENNPPETKKTFDRLRKAGYTKYEAKQFIGQCVAVELFKVMKHQEPFDEERYVNNLRNLPEEPFDDSED